MNLSTDAALSRLLKLLNDGLNEAVHEREPSHARRPLQGQEQCAGLAQVLGQLQPKERPHAIR